MHSVSVRGLGLLLLAFCVAGVDAQTAPPPAEGASKPGYTLHVGTRVVLTDVTVTDRYGNPIRKLDRAAFHIFDNGRPEQIASFAEHTGEESVAIPPPQGKEVFSNSYLGHPPPVFDAILIDATTIHIVDQMYLTNQLDKFVEALPAGEPLAIYARLGGSVVLMQDFTSDHARLHAAVHKAIPRLQQPGSWAASDLDTLQQMIMFLRQYPGRKDLIWFSGGSNLALLADATGFPTYVNMQPLYDELETTRIAVYPVDARGLTVSEPGGMPFQHMMMEDTAEATGGQAFFNTNGLADAASRIASSSANFYTLTYSPHEQKFDNRWHKVKIKIEGGSYRLSYRRGYYDDGAGAGPPSGEVRTALRADGTTTQKQPEVPKTPIIFTATVLPANEAVGRPSVPAVNEAGPLKKNERSYRIHYTLPAADFVQQSSDGRQSVRVGAGLLAVNSLGTPIARQVNGLSIGIDPDKFRANPDGTIGFDEEIHLPRGEDFLYIIAWDEASGRFGMVQVPVTVPKPGD